MRSFLHFIFLLSFARNAWGLSLEEYLSQVESNHRGLRGSQQSGRGALMRFDEGDLLYSPRLFVKGTYFKNELEKSYVPVESQGQWASELGIRQRTPWGLDVEVSSQFERNSLRGYSGSPHSLHSYSLTVSASLLKNFLGSESNGSRSAVSARARAAHFGDKFMEDSIHVEAEATYWDLYLARSHLNFQKESLSRAQRLFNWNDRKARVELVNKSSLEQARANLQVRKSLLLSAENNTRAVSHRFNVLRSVDHDRVEDLADERDLSSILALKAPSRNRIRADYASKKAQLFEAKSMAQVARESHKPDLRVFTTLKSQGQSDRGDSWRSIDRSSGFDHNAYVVGLSLEMPLSFVTEYDTIRGWNAEIEAAHLKSDQVDFEDEREWAHLLESFQEAQSLLKSRMEVEAVQSKRMNVEQELFERGRSTTFQVVQAEEDLSSSQLARLDAEARVLTLYAQMKYYQ